MTLLEVLAAVFCLGMGLIMVAGAFPAATHQTRQTIDRTDATMMAESGMELYLKAERAQRKLTQSQLGPASGTAESTTSVALPVYSWCVWNPDRFAYLENFDESKLSPPGGGDYVMRGFLTRVSTSDETPLYRMTIVVIRYNNEKPEFYGSNGSGGKDWAVRSLTATAISLPSNTVAVSGLPTGTTPPTSLGGDRYVSMGDYIMDTSSGICYEIASVPTSGSSGSLKLVEPLMYNIAPPAALHQNRPWFVFRNVVGVYYKLVS
jgi:type II secretory pathway pseudopilin PulG